MTPNARPAISSGTAYRDPPNRRDSGLEPRIARITRIGKGHGRVNYPCYQCDPWLVDSVCQSAARTLNPGQFSLLASTVTGNLDAGKQSIAKVSHAPRG